MGLIDDPKNLDILAEDNVRTLKLPKARLNPPVAIILIGIPASGKSRLVENLTNTFPLAVLSEEEMLKFLAPRISFFERAQEEILALAEKTIEKLILGSISCIFDYSVKKRRDRGLLREVVEKAGGKFILIYIDIPKEEAYKQLSKINYEVSRGEKKGVIMDKDLFEYEVANITPPSAAEGALVFQPQKPESMQIIIDQLSRIAGF